MEFEVEQSRLLSALSLAQTVADKRHTMPILGNVLLTATEQGQVVCSSTDMMIALHEAMDAKVIGTGSLTLGAGPLHDVVRTLPAGTLRIKALENQWAQILCAGSEFKIMGMFAGDFPGLPEDIDPSRSSVELFEVPSHALSDLIQKTVFSVSSDEARVNLNGALLECDGQTGMMVSTDGHRLTKFSRPFPGLSLQKGIIVPRKGMLEIRRVLDRVSGPVQIGVEPPYLYLHAGELRLSVKLNDVMFPPYKAVIPGSVSAAHSIGTGNPSRGPKAGRGDGARKDGDGSVGPQRGPVRTHGR